MMEEPQWETMLPADSGIKQFGNLEVDLTGHVVRLRGVEVRLSPIEFALLQQLIIHAGKVLPHRMLLQRIWGPE